MNSTELMVVFLGFGIVFAVLAILYVVMVIMNLVAGKKRKKAPEPLTAPAVQETRTAPVSGDDDAETAAAITAALAVVMDVPVSAVRLRNFYEMPAHPTHYTVADPWDPNGRVIEAWRPTYQNTDGGNRNEKLYSKDKWKNI